MTCLKVVEANWKSGFFTQVIFTNFMFFRTFCAESSSTYGVWLFKSQNHELSKTYQFFFQLEFKIALQCCVSFCRTTK